MYRYSALWKTFGPREFNYDEASEILGKLASVILSELKKYRWLAIKLDPEDSRKRLYTLKSPEEAISEMGTDE